MKTLHLLLAIGFVGLTPAALAQAPATESELMTKLNEISTAKPAATPEVTAKAVPGVNATEITATREATFNNETQTAVFLGDVHVKDPQFTLRADKLTAHLRKQEPEAKGAKPTPAPTPGKNSDAPKTGGLKNAVAEGNVVIVQEKPNADGKGVTRYVGKSKRAYYNSETGEMKLVGSPQVQEGINVHLATDPSTVMILHSDTRSMETQGPSRTIISDKVAEPSAKTK